MPGAWRRRSDHDEKNRSFSRARSVVLNSLLISAVVALAGSGGGSAPHDDAWRRRPHRRSGCDCCYYINCIWRQLLGRSDPPAVPCSLWCVTCPQACIGYWEVWIACLANTGVCARGVAIILAVPPLLRAANAPSGIRPPTGFPWCGGGTSCGRREYRAPTPPGRREPPGTGSEKEILRTLFSVLAVGGRVGMVDAGDGGT